MPVNADIRSIDVILVEEDDPHVNPIGAKGIVEIGIVGVAPAIRERGVSRDGEAHSRSADRPRQIALGAPTAPPQGYVPLEQYGVSVPGSHVGRGIGHIGNSFGSLSSSRSVAQ